MEDAVAASALAASEGGSARRTTARRLRAVGDNEAAAQTVCRIRFRFLWRLYFFFFFNYCVCLGAFSCPESTGSLEGGSVQRRICKKNNIYIYIYIGCLFFFPVVKSAT